MGESKMDKKPLMGVCICAVVLLVLGSLSNVVGYQSVKSTAVNDSPLFSVRTQKATNQLQNSISSQYLGKGNGNQLTFFIRVDRTELFDKVFNQVTTLNDKAFEQFLEMLGKKIKHNYFIKESDYKDIIHAFSNIRSKAQKIPEHSVITSDIETICPWYPGCIIFSIVDFIVGLSSLFFIIYCTIKFHCWHECPGCTYKTVDLNLMRRK
jgi:hypothetical protein